MKHIANFLIICLSAALVRAQTQTVVDANGETVVERVTVVAGVPTTRTLQTLDADDTLTATIQTTTQIQGPVAQPGATATGVTTFQYTTTDALGETTVILDTFTPSSVTATVAPSQTFTGTVLDYSEWLTMVGTNTVSADSVAASSASTRHFLSRKACAVGAALLSGAIGGAWFVFV